MAQDPAFTDYDWDNFLKGQGYPGIQVGDWAPAQAAPGSDVANEGWFNPGTQGSITAAINAQNPTADRDKSYVQFGNTGGYQDGVGVTIGPGRSITPAAYVDQYNQAVSKYGKGTTDEWLSRNAFDVNRISEALGDPGSGGGGSGGSGGGSGRGNTSPQFTDPTQRLMEDNALGRYNQLTNPDPNSGTAMFEQYARQLFDTLQDPVYSASDEAIIKGRAFDALTRERDATLQQWRDEMARRNLPLSSGPALEGLRKINEHYETLRTQTESDFARGAIDQTRAQRFQALNTAGQLAGSEENRLDKATQYAAIPYGLTQDAFARNLALMGAGGSPASVLSSALSLLANGQQMNQFNSAQQSALSEGLMQYLGYWLA